MADELPFVDIVTVNYNGRGSLEDYFRSLEELDYPKQRMRLIFCDNGSRDGSLEFV